MWIYDYIIIIDLHEEGSLKFSGKVTAKFSVDAQAKIIENLLKGYEFDPDEDITYCEVTLYDEYNDFTCEEVIQI